MKEITGAAASDMPGASRATSFLDLFGCARSRNADRIAVRCGTAQLSFDQLDARAELIADQLIQHGACPGTLVGVLLPRSTDLIAALLAVVKTGAAYLPLDPGYPAQRVEHVLRDCSAPLVLSCTSLMGRLPANGRALAINVDAIASEVGVAANAAANHRRLAGSDDPFYLIYTSGSTGIPKGSVLPLRGPLNQYQHYIEALNFNSSSRSLVISSIGFDLTQRTIWAPLLAGGRVVLSDSRVYDAALIVDEIAREGITHLCCTPSAFYPLIDDADETQFAKLASLREMALGGEPIQMSRLAAWRASAHTTARLTNCYGPTECSANVSLFHLARGEPAPAGDGLPIGRPIANMRLHVLGPERQPLAVGEEGELGIAGIGVSTGYLNRPDLNVERFVQEPGTGERMYLSGDRARWRADGNLEVLGRIDSQVKVRGVRIELGEVEAVLGTLPQVREAAAAVHADRLCGYLVPIPGHEIDLQDARVALQRVLPEAMVPEAWSVLEQLPVNAHGKLDRGELPPPSRTRPALAVAYAAPRGPLESWLAAEIEAATHCEGVGRDDPFFELGGTSLSAVRLVARASRKLGCELRVIGLFTAPTAAGYAQTLAVEHAVEVSRAFGAEALSFSKASGSRGAKRRGPRADRIREDIAIVGMAARLPGADDVDRFWRNLQNGVEAVRDITDEELDAAGVSAEMRADPHFVRRVVTLDNPDRFDAAFFGYSPREAEQMDPQQRIFLECAYAALEHAGHDPARDGHHIGVFAGVSRNSYFQHHLASNPATRPLLPEVQITYSNDKDYIATRVSYKLDLHGPSFTAQSACSTSGVLLHLARQSLLNHECDAALVGGARVVCPLNAGYLWVEGSILSRDGRMRAFDANGSGMIRSSGTACLVLKRVSDAVRDSNTIYAVIKGSALNNDGAGKAAFSAPSVIGQSAVIRMALDDAEISADQICYVDAHGTSTYLGDPIEVTALTRAYREDTARLGYCRIGSSKSNVGHLDSCAGVVSVIKTALMLHHREFVPSAGFEAPNPQIDFASTPFLVADRHQPWMSSEPRRAGVSSFGIGGTNAHLVLEEGPVAPTPHLATRRWQLLPLSAKTDASLKAAAARHATWWAEHSDAALADAAWTLQTGRSQFEHRGFVVVDSAAEAATALSGESFVTGRTLSSPRLVFVFPGQGAQHPGMGRDLYQTEPCYRAIVDEGCEILKAQLQLDLRDVLYPAPPDIERAAAQLRQTVLAQPAIFLVSYALARLFQGHGMCPAEMVGHSVGEFVAATLAGVFRFEDALCLLATRARLMQSMPGGSMLAVRLSEDATRALMPSDISLAAVNAPQLSVVSGPSPSMDAFEASLREQAVGAVRLHTSHAFHSPMMDPVVEAFAHEVAKVERQPPRIPITSTLTGNTLTAQEAQDPRYWARQLREAVRFAPAIAKVLEKPGAVLLEVGPGQSLSAPLRQIGSTGAASTSTVVSSAPPAAQEDASAAQHFVNALGRVWISGLLPDWKAVHGGARRRIGLPTYAFARTRHWVEAGSITTASGVVATPPSSAVTVTATPASATDADPIRDRALAILIELTGLSFAPEDDARSFLELGMDSLLLTQVAGKVKNAFKLDLRFRQLLEELNTVGKLLSHLRAHGTLGNPAPGLATGTPETGDTPKKSFGAGTRISTNVDVLSPLQRHALDRLTARYIARTSQSKASTQQHRRHLADPRTVSGFKPMWKEIIYPIVSTRSDGAYLWDLDGNRYIDTVNGFGATLFGHRPAFVNDAVKAQLDRGYEIGPIQDFIGDCALRFTRMVDLDRVTFCNTGSEAVSAAQRCARTVTGRDLIVSFVNDYHGVHDEVIVRRGPGGRGLPAASGIPAAHTSQTLILDYGDPKSLDVIRSRASEIAAVMVEPIQSRNQDLQPRAFLHALRELCTQADCAFIMDEVITGFRLAPGGAQEHFGVKADLATYGKVFGGGMPIGAVAGIPKYMDALDGGWWQFGDSSVPEAGVTYFAGTFVRHPLAMAAVAACLQHLEAHPDLQRDMNTRTLALVERLRGAFAERRAPLNVSTYASIFRFEFTQDEPFGELLAHYFRQRGVHTYDHRNQVMTTCHDEAVMETLFKAYTGAVDDMQRDGLLGRIGAPVTIGLTDKRPGARWYAAPIAGGRLGRTADGTPAWFVEDPKRIGKFLQLID